MTKRSAAWDRAEISEVVLRYCRAVDRLDLDALRAVYHPGGVDHHTGFSGTIEEYIPWVSAALSQFSGTMHLIANQLVDLDGDTAICESYGQAVHWGEPADDPRRNFTSGFRYVDHFAFDQGRWAIIERWAVREWTRSDAGRRLPKEGEGPAGSRGPEDPLRQLQRRLDIGDHWPARPAGDTHHARPDDLERRLRRIEDELALMRIIASYGPAVDSGSAQPTAGIWTQDGIYDVFPQVLRGRTEIAEMVTGERHQGMINSGAAHLQGPPYISIDGDRATVTHYSQLVLRDADADSFRVWRTGVNIWTFVRTSDGWRAINRVNRQLDGTAEAREMLGAAVDPKRR